MGSKRKTDWQSIRIVIEVADQVNPRNPYADMNQACRNQVFRELARRVLLRKAEGNANDINNSKL